MIRRAGQLRHLVTIERLTAGSPQQTGSGEPDESWATFAIVRASIEPLEGRELFSAQAVNNEVTVRIRMWYIAGVVPKMRVSHGGLYYDILSVINKELRNRELELMCKEGMSDG